MRQTIYQIIKGKGYYLLIFLFLAGSIQRSYSQSHPAPVLPDTSKLGQYTSRTMNLLHKSSPANKNDVRILVYGQSISEQEWWLEVKRTVGERFPDANLIMENIAVGGFSTQYLFKTVEMDISSFYPDLVLLHIYGGIKDYETVLSTIRSRTTAEVAIMTDHYIGENRWSDTMSYYLLPSLAEKYKCDIINIRDPWKTYLKDNNLQPSELLRDGIHLNDFGNFLMAELVKPLFCFKSFFPDDPFDLLTSISFDDLKSFRADTIVFPFKGNRVDLVYNTTKTDKAKAYRIVLDGKSPSAFAGTYYMTRPYNRKGESWPWVLPAMIRIDHTAPWTTEEWSCVYTDAAPPYTDFRFEISGSVTGPDGQGAGSQDFVSPSGRVIIKGGDSENGGDWHLERSYKVLKTMVNSGDTVKWKTYSVSADAFVASSENAYSGNRSLILFQGVPNGDHVLKITTKGGRFTQISGIKVYRPYWNRK